MPVAFLLRWVFQRSLEKAGPPSTFLRLWTSHHLSELQWIAVLTFLLWVGATIGILSENVAIWRASWNDLGTAISSHVAELGGLSTVAGGILSWAYLTGSKRLGVVDLFAFEIAAICRTSLIFDFAKTSVARAEGPISVTDGPGKFTSEEHYTPVYDNNLSDLQPLSLTVVSHVTEFYTYRKVMMDLLRRIAAEENASNKSGTWRMMIYMQFLMYESARHATKELIEYEPHRGESLINILCSELVVFTYLLKSFGEKTDARHMRLRLRRNEYREDVAEILHQVVGTEKYPNWSRARTTAVELEARFNNHSAEWPRDDEVPPSPKAAKRPQPMKAAAQTEDIQVTPVSRERVARRPPSEPSSNERRQRAP